MPRRRKRRPRDTPADLPARRAERGTGRIYQTRVSQRQAFLSVGRGDCRHDQRRVRSRSKGRVSFVQRKTHRKGTPVTGAAERSSRGDRRLDRLSRGGSRGIGDGRNTYRAGARSRRSHRFARGLCQGKEDKIGGYRCALRQAEYGKKLAAQQAARL